MSTSRARSFVFSAITAISVPAIMLGMLGFGAPPASAAEPDPSDTAVTAFTVPALGWIFVNGRHVSSTFTAAATGVPWRMTLTSREPSVSVSISAHGTTVATATAADVIASVDLAGTYRFTYGLHPVEGTAILSGETYTLTVASIVHTRNLRDFEETYSDMVALANAVQPTTWCSTSMSEATWSCTDGSYQIATTVLVQPDTSDPSATVAFSPAAPDGNGDWYTTLPTAAFTCTDDGSGVAACPETLRAATDGGWTPTGTVTDGVGNSAVVTGPTIKIDTTPPAVTTQITGTLGENGWYTSTPVSVLRTCTDPVAGDGSHSDMATCPPNRYASDGVFTVPADQATDRAGNTTDVDQVVVKVDSVGPVIEFTKNVDTFTFTCTDKAPAYDRAPASGNALGYGKMRDIQTSGVATCPDPVTLSPTDPTATVKATDNAGNATEMAISVPSDTAGPTVITTIVGAANRAGWYHGPVRLSFTCTDTVSGMTGGQASCPADVTLTRDGRNLTVEVTAVDKAGNETTVRIPGISIDATAPTAALTGVRTGQSVTAGTRPARCAGADALSGVASCTLLVTGPTNGIGWVTVRALATDRAGNTTTSAPVRYQVTPKVTVSWTAGTLRVGHSYVFTVRLTDAAGHLVSGIVPRYLWPTKLTATGAGRTPYLDGGTLLRVSPGVYRVRVTLSPRMIAAPYWTFAISVAGVTSPRVYRVTR